MGKRGAAASPAKVAAKKAKGEAEAHHHVLELLHDPVLKAALPYAAVEPKDRHQYQEQMLDACAVALREEEAARAAAVEAAEKGVASLDADIESAKRALEAAEQTCAVLQAQAAALGSALPEGAVTTAEEAVAAAKGAAATHASGKEELAAAIAEYASAKEEVLIPLKEGTAGVSKAPRKRMAKILGMVKTAGAPESLLEALQVALNQKPDKRGEFGVKAIEAAEDLYRRHQEGLAEKMASYDLEGKRLEALVEEAEASLVAAKAAHAAALDEYTNAQNAWGDSTNGVVDAQAALRTLPSPKQRAAELEEAKALLGRATEAIAELQRLRDGPAPEAEVTLPTTGEAPADAQAEATLMEVTAQ